MSGEKRALTRAQVLAWRGETWSHTDKLFLNQCLDLLPADGIEFYREPRGGRVIVEVDGDKAFVIRPGFVSWPKGTWVTGVDGSLVEGGIRVGGENDGTVWASLSTFQSAERSTKRELRDFGTCPTCCTAMPATRTCPTCD